MLRTLVIGLMATVLGVAVWLLTSMLHIGGPGGVLGVGAGLVLGLIDDRSPVARYGAFLIGLVLGLLALVLGMAGWVGFVVAMLIFTIISGLTGGRLPFWAMLLSSGVLAAAYGPELIATPWFALTQFPTTFFVILATSAGGFIVALLVEAVGAPRPGGPEQAERPSQPEFGGTTPVAAGGSTS